MWRSFGELIGKGSNDVDNLVEIGEQSVTIRT